MKNRKYLLLAFFLLCTVCSKAIAGSYTCNEDEFNLFPEDTEDWKASLPVDEETVAFPLVFYMLYDSMERLGFWNSPVKYSGIVYLGYFTVDDSWRAEPTCLRTEELYGALCNKYEGLITIYNASRPRHSDFANRKKYFEDFFLNADHRKKYIYILDAPGEAPDKEYVPETDQDIYQCAEKARVNNLLMGRRLHDRSFSLFRPVNLKPGMRVLLPEPPGDESEEVTAKCNEYKFNLGSWNLEGWKSTLPIEEETAQFPLVLYRLFDPVGRSSNPPLELSGVVYVNYLVVDSNWHVANICDNTVSRYLALCHDFTEVVNKYNASRSANGSFTERKEHFEETFSTLNGK